MAGPQFSLIRFFFGAAILVGLVLSPSNQLPGVQGFAQTAVPAAVESNSLQPLTVGNPLQRELRAGEIHACTVSATAGQFFSVVAEQNGADLLVRLSDPAGKPCGEFNVNDSRKGKETACVIARMSGSYRVEVVHASRNEPKLTYWLKLIELRPAVETDEYAVQARLLETEAVTTKRREGRKALPTVTATYQKAIALWQKAGDLASEADTWISLGTADREAEEGTQALAAFHQALTLFQKLGSTDGESRTLNFLGLCYLDLGDLPHSETLLNQALERAELNSPLRRKADTFNSLGLLAFAQGDWVLTTKRYQQALDWYRQEGDRRGMAAMLNNLADTHNSVADHRKAMAYMAELRALYHEEENHRAEAVVISNLGTICLNWHDYQKAIEFFTLAMPLRRSLGDRRGLSRTCQQLGDTYLELDDFANAKKQYEQALNLRRETGERSGEAEMLLKLGILYTKTAPPDRSQAMEYLSKALTMYQEVSSKEGEGEVRKSLGSLLFDLGEIRKGTEQLEQAVTLAEALNSRRYLSQIHQNVGNIYREAGLLPQAFAHLKLSLELMKSWESPYSKAMSLHSLALVEAARGNLLAAKQWEEESQKLVETFHQLPLNQDFRTSIFSNREDQLEFYVDLLMKLHRQQPQAGYAAQALAVSEGKRARNLLELLAQSSQRVIQGVDPKLLEQEQKLRFLRLKKAEALNDLLDREAPVAEQQALRTEIEQLSVRYEELQTQIRQKSPNYAALTQPHPLNLEEIQRQLLDDNTILIEYELTQDRSFVWVVGQTSMDAVELAPQEEIETVARQVCRELQIPVASPSRNLRKEPTPQESIQPSASLRTLSRLVLDPIAHLLGKKRLLIVSDGVLQQIPFGALPQPQGLGSRVQGSGKLTQSSVLSPQSSTLNTQSSVLSPQSSALGSQSSVLSPQSSALGSQSSVLSPQSSALSPLIVSHEIINLPSASTLGLLRAEFAKRPTASKSLLVLADPVFEPDDPRVKPTQAGLSQPNPPATEFEFNPAQVALRNLTPLSPTTVVVGANPGTTPRTIPRLPGTLREAHAILNQVQSNQARCLTGFAANRSALEESDISQYRIVHLATHGFVNDERPEFSGLVLSLLDQTGHRQNGFLLLSEIFNLHLGADLVVLSACGTGLGKNVRNEGIVGLTRGFMYAGSPRVVVSLWNVSDQGTAELMSRFYKQMFKHRLPPAAALRQAQIEMLRHPQWSAPYYWAAFQLQGEWK
ncbi:MAG: CHAT domain-containing protein [Blastocatellia bacterium]|nr:CHAT domain-containing protein [Blastocatellia bacterium]